MEQTEVENSGSLTLLPHCLISLWGDAVALFVPSSRARSTTSATAAIVGRLTLHGKLDDASAPTSLRQQPVRWADNVAQCEQNQIPFGHSRKTVWTVNPENHI